METYCGLFFCRPWESILVSSMCTTLLGCVSLTQHVSPLCQPNTRQLSSTMYSRWDFQQNFYIWCGIHQFLKKKEETLLNFLKKFSQKVLWNFHSKFSKTLSCRKFCLEISSLWLCELDFFWFIFFSRFIVLHLSCHAGFCHFFTVLIWFKL